MSNHRSISSPKKFIIAKDLLLDPSAYIHDFGNKALIVCDVFFLDTVNTTTKFNLQKNNVGSVIEKFAGECTQKEVDRLCEIREKNNCDVIVGIGGGKTLDAAKAVAYQHKKPVIIVPTIASTDAPCTALSVLYKENGEFDKYLFLPENPDAVLADPNVLVKAPARFFSAGIGDALATYFEARACYNADGLNLILRKPSATGLAIAKLCFDLLKANVEQAMISVENKVSSPAFEACLEATIYASGVGAESGGLAAAHAVNNGMSVVPELHRAQHGEKVVFGLLTQLVLENTPKEELEEVINIIKIAKLPLCLEDFGLKEWKEEDWRAVAQVACAEGDTMGNMVRKVTAKDVYDAMKVADSLGKYYRDK